MGQPWTPRWMAPTSPSQSVVIKQKDPMKAYSVGQAKWSCICLQKTTPLGQGTVVAVLSAPGAGSAVTQKKRVCHCSQCARYTPAASKSAA